MLFPACVSASAICVSPSSCPECRWTLSSFRGLLECSLPREIFLTNSVQDRLSPAHLFCSSSYFVVLLNLFFSPSLCCLYFLPAACPRGHCLRLVTAVIPAPRRVWPRGGLLVNLNKGLTSTCFTICEVLSHRTCHVSFTVAPGGVQDRNK